MSGPNPDMAASDVEARVLIALLMVMEETPNPMEAAQTVIRVVRRAAAAGEMCEHHAATAIAYVETQVAETFVELLTEPPPKGPLQ